MTRLQFTHENGLDETIEAERVQFSYKCNVREDGDIYIELQSGIHAFIYYTGTPVQYLSYTDIIQIWILYIENISPS